MAGNAGADSDMLRLSTRGAGSPEVLKRWPRPLIGLITGAVIAVHLVLVFTLLFTPPMLLKLVAPDRRLRHRCGLAMSAVGQLWGRGVWFIVRTLHAPRWVLKGFENIDSERSYLLIGNHQSWADIMLLAAIVQDRIPFFRFFIKYELLWVPIIGVACWAMDCPFMKRPNREAIRRNPALAEEDLRTTRIACERLRGLPVTIVNYVEGTRYTAAKHAAQQSPYRHLLKPKSGGVALTLNAMADQFECLLDLTIVYPPGVTPDLWSFLCGDLDPVHFELLRRPIPPEVASGDYRGDPDYRARVQHWLNRIWTDKDALIARVQQR